MSSFENSTINGTLFNKNITTNRRTSGKLLMDGLLGMILLILIVIVLYCLQFVLHLWNKFRSSERAPVPGVVQVVINVDVPRDPNQSTPPGNSTPLKPSVGSASGNLMPPKPDPDLGPGTASTINDVLESSSDLSSHKSTTAAILSDNQYATTHPSDIDGSPQGSNFIADSSVVPGTYYLCSNFNNSLDADTFHPTCALILQDVRTYEVPEGLDHSEDNDGCRTSTSHSNPAIMLQDLGMCRFVDSVPIDHADDSGLCMKTVRSDSAIITENLRTCHVSESTDQSNASQVETFKMRHMLEDTDGLNNNVVDEALTLDPDPTLVKSEDLEMSHLSKTDDHLNVDGD